MAAWAWWRRSPLLLGKVIRFAFRKKRREKRWAGCDGGHVCAVPAVSDFFTKLQYYLGRQGNSAFSGGELGGRVSCGSYLASVA